MEVHVVDSLIADVAAAVASRFPVGVGSSQMNAAGCYSLAQVPLVFAKSFQR
jgi:hypothetical protein